MSSNLHPDIASDMVEDTRKDKTTETRDALERATGGNTSTDDAETGEDKLARAARQNDRAGSAGKDKAQ